MEKKAAVVMIPAPGIGHLVPSTEFADGLMQLDDQLTVTILLFRVPFAPDLDSYAQSLASKHPRIQFLNLPFVEPPPMSDLVQFPERFFSVFVESHKQHVREAITNHVVKNSERIACLVLDLFCTSMIDVGNELGVPCYLFCTSSAACLRFTMHLSWISEQELREKNDFDIPGYVNSVPRSVFPSSVFNEKSEYMRKYGRRCLETKGLIINTFVELETEAIRSLDGDRFPPVYAVGPILDLKGVVQGQSSDQEIMKWLDDQPPRSVVFLCFGSTGSFGTSHLKEIALALEKSGHRFLWSIRKPPPEAGGAMSGELENFVQDALPDGFLERTKARGRICGKAPQIQVLGHEAVGAFVSHCGWNSTLEALWTNVPIVTWPMFGEQQLNAFQLVRDLELAVELTLDYNMGSSDFVPAKDIEQALNRVMDRDKEVRKRIKDMSEMARNAVLDGGSSSRSLQRLIHAMLGRE